MIKQLLLATAIAIAFITSGCASAQTPSNTDASAAAAAPTPAAAASSGAVTSSVAVAQAAGWDLNKIPLLKFGRADFVTAANYATSNGYPGRAAVWNGIVAQYDACDAAVMAAAPKLPPKGSTVGLFTGIEVTAELAGQGIPPAVAVNCNIPNFAALLGLVLKL